ncbi:hypothetical protein PIB30_104458, partial [Stylosanthes scabra]|nr:hypothetical protein [Stylosanthes scabra]
TPRCERSSKEASIASKEQLEASIASKEPRRGSKTPRRDSVKLELNEGLQHPRLGTHDNA